MNRKRQINDIASRTGKMKKDIAIFVDAYESAIMDSLRGGDSVLLHGFMRIEHKTKKEYIGHTFGKKDAKIIPERQYVKIRPGTALTECVK